MLFGHEVIREIAKFIQVSHFHDGKIEIFGKFNDNLLKIPNYFDIYRETITHLDNSKIPMDKRGKMEKDAQIMIKMLPQQVEMEKKMRKSSSNSDAVLQFGTKLNKSVVFDYNEQEGRFTKTNRKMKVGEEVLVESAVCASLMEKFSKSHCQHCFARYTPCSMS